MEFPVLKATNVTKIFPPMEKGGKPTVALERFSLEIGKGQMVALIGPDGAGKTTFLRLVEKLLDLTSGKIELFGKNLKDQPDEIKDRIAYMPQQFGLYEDLTVQENLNLFADLKDIPDSQRASVFAELLNMTGLAAFTDRPAGKLSGGMKQKLGIACALVSKPDLLILDEPTAGVDPLSRQELWKIVRATVEKNQTSVLLSTGYMDEAAMCNHIYIMNSGKCLINGTLQELIEPYKGQVFYLPSGNKKTRTLLEEATSSKDVIDAIPKGSGVRVLLKKDTDINNLCSKLDVTGSYPLPPGLEDTFMAVLKEAQEKNNELESFGTFKVSDQKVYLVNPNEVLISVHDLVKKFGSFTAVNDTSFEVTRGEIFGLLGPNGAGKTTTFKMLCGLLPATSGKINVAGYNLRTARAAARKNIGYVAQFFSLYPSFTILENLTFFGGAYGLDGDILEQRIKEVSEQFELEKLEDEISGDLNAGFKKRLSMAAALIHDPEILFLDEPTSSIDPLARRNFWSCLNHLADIGKTIIITTHFMEEAEYCTKMAIQSAGKMLALGSPAQIKKDAGLKDTDSMNEAFVRIVEKQNKERIS